MADCADIDCRSRWVAARWADDQAGVTAGIRAIEDPVVRLALVRQVTAAHPGEATALCDLLDGKDEQESCRARNNRPHLKAVNVAKPAEAPADAGSSAFGLVVTDRVASPWKDVAARTVPCSVETRVCQSEAAEKSAAAADIPGAAALCAAIAEPEWRAECFFKAGEAAMALPGPEAGQAVSLCLGAAGYAGRCLSHVLPGFGPRAPAASSGDDAAWKAIEARITSDRALLAADPDLASLYEARAWGFALQGAYLREPEVTGVPRGLPDVAAPHVRAAAAWRLLTVEADQERDLSGWQQRLEAVLANDAPRAGERRLPDSTAPKLRGLWERVLPREEAIPKVAYLGENKRALGKTAALDATICLIEGAAIQDPPNFPLLEEGLDHRAVVVRWTAARLLRALAPDDIKLRHHDDDAALVRDRLPPRTR